MIVWTIGHSTRSFDEFVALLERDHIRQLVDIRAFPGSRRHPQFGADALARALVVHGIAYSHMPELGGRRRPDAHAPPTAWRNASFRAYAAYMLTDAFRLAIDRLIDVARAAPTAIMCSEAVPWRCHRNLVSDALTARGVEVRHIMDARTQPHTLTPFAVVRNGLVTYPAG